MGFLLLEAGLADSETSLAGSEMGIVALETGLAVLEAGLTVLEAGLAVLNAAAVVVKRPWRRRYKEEDILAFFGGSERNGKGVVLSMIGFYQGLKFFLSFS